MTQQIFHLYKNGTYVGPALAEGAQKFVDAGYTVGPDPGPRIPTQAELDTLADEVANRIFQQSQDEARALGETLAEVVFRVSNSQVPQNITEAQARTWVRDTFREKYRALL